MAHQGNMGLTWPRTQILEVLLSEPVGLIHDATTFEAEGIDWLPGDRGHVHQIAAAIQPVARVRVLSWRDLIRVVFDIGDEHVSPLLRGLLVLRCQLDGGHTLVLLHCVISLVLLGVSCAT